MYITFFTRAEEKYFLIFKQTKVILLRLTGENADWLRLRTSLNAYKIIRKVLAKMDSLEDYKELERAYDSNGVTVFDWVRPIREGNVLELLIAYKSMPIADSGYYFILSPSYKYPGLPALKFRAKTEEFYSGPANALDTLNLAEI